MYRHTDYAQILAESDDARAVITALIDHAYAPAEVLWDILSFLDIEIPAVNSRNSYGDDAAVAVRCYIRARFGYFRHARHDGHPAPAPVRVFDLYPGIGYIFNVAPKPKLHQHGYQNVSMGVVLRGVCGAKLVWGMFNFFTVAAFVAEYNDMLSTLCKLAERLRGSGNRRDVVPLDRWHVSNTVNLTAGAATNWAHRTSPGSGNMGAFDAFVAFVRLWSAHDTSLLCASGNVRTDAAHAAHTGPVLLRHALLRQHWNAVFNIDTDPVFANDESCAVASKALAEWFECMAQCAGSASLVKGWTPV